MRTTSSCRGRLLGLSVAFLGGALLQSLLAAVHPGMLHTNADFTRMAQKVNANAQPWKGSWDLLVASTNSQSTWNARPTATVIRGGSGDNAAQLYNDVHAAYQNALRWKISGNVAHANKAVEIMNGWSASLTSIGGNADRFLAAGLYGYQFANAAEIMRGYSGWASADFNRFKTMMITVFYPMNNDFLLNHNTAHIQNYWANWDLCNMASILAIGILCDDQAKIDQAVNYFKTGGGNGSINNAVPILHSPTLGQWQESGRDQEHALMGVGLMAAICEMAWNQGIDLYGYNNSRFMAGAEYVARYNNNEGVPFAPYSWRSGQGGTPNTHTVVSNAGRNATRPIWDMIVGHYAQRRGLHIGDVEQKAASTRPEGGPQYGAHGSAFDHLGFTTLTHYRDPVATTVPEGTYYLRNRASGRYLDNLGATADGAEVSQWSYSASPNQKWHIAPAPAAGYLRLIGLTGGKALDSINHTADDTTVAQWGLGGSQNQQWTLPAAADGYRKVLNRANGKALDTGGANGNGAIMEFWYSNSSPNQQWFLTAGSTVTQLVSHNFPTRTLRHSGYRAQIDENVFPAQDGEFRVVLGLSGSTGVSLESINFPGRFLRVRANGEVWVDTYENTAAYRDSATFRRVAGLADAAKSSFQMWTDSTRYLRHSAYILHAQTISGSAAQSDATFAEVVFN